MPPAARPARGLPTQTIMLRIFVWSLAFALGSASLAVAPLFSQAPSREVGAAQEVDAVREVRAVSATDDAVQLDGRLDEPIWLRATPATGFRQLQPHEGEPAPESTEVRFAITPSALIISARMHSAQPEAIRALVTRRDRDIPSEELLISLDTRRDRLTAYSFAVRPSGSRRDMFHGSDNFGDQDGSYDPVWQAATRIDSTGWTAEIRIPLTQLRFDAGDDESWGLNIVRVVPERNEQTFWALVPSNENGWSSRMGKLAGLGTLHAPLRLELLPYVAVGAARSGEVDAANPFSTRSTQNFRAGADLKVGLGSSLTLDATINPDFGQVEADPAEVNLTSFETEFAERRPFFVEGSNLLGGRGTFYSRRIGARPVGHPDTPFAEEVDNSTILGAAKATGRLPSGLSVGTLAAVTAEEKARTFDPDNRFGAAVVAPLTTFGVVTAQQELGRDRSTIKASLTAVQRELEPGSPLASLLVRHAYTGLVDGRWRWAGGRYDMSAYLSASHIEGEAGAILVQQRSSRRYFQRPDAENFELDPTRSTLSGVNLGINHSKMAGDWLWDVDIDYATPGYEINDLGFQSRANYTSIGGNIRRRRTTPGAVFQRWSLGAEGSGSWNSDGDRTATDAGIFADVTWKNFWSSSLELGHTPRSQNDRLTRGGPLMQTPRSWRAELDLESSDAQQTHWELSAQGSRDELGGWREELDAGITFRAGARWEGSVEPSLSRGVTSRQYVTARPGGGEPTYGGRYIFAKVERSEVSARFRSTYAITPELTLEGYLEPFASSGTYSAFGELEAARSFDMREYGEDGTIITRTGGGYQVADGDSEVEFRDPAFNVRSFRSNMVLRWEWRPGSTAYLVWQQDRFEDRDRIDPVGPGGLFQALGAPGDNVVALKVSYWWAM